MTKKNLYNEDPILEVGKWRILCPNALGKKYTMNPLLVHKCTAYRVIGSNTDTWEDMSVPHRPEGNPQCSRCEDPVPEEIQGLLAMYYMDHA